MFLRTLFLVLCLAALGGSFSAPACAQGAVLPEEDDSNWLSVFDFQEREAFSMFGPPLKEDMSEAQAQTQLYLDMVEHFYEVAEDEDDFQFIVEAFSVPVEQFRPNSFRPEGGVVDDLFPDDPLPQLHKTTSRYVDSVRMSTLPGAPFEARSLATVKLGDDTGGPRSLFTDDKKDAAIAKETGKEAPNDAAAKKEAEAEQKKKEAEAAAAGKINAPPKAPLPNSDMETLHLLQQAVRDLGLQKELNFENNLKRQTLVSEGQQNKPGSVSAPPSETTPAPEKTDAAPTPAETKKDEAPAGAVDNPASKVVMPAADTTTEKLKNPSPKKTTPAKSAGAEDIKDKTKKKKPVKKKEPLKNKKRAVIKEAPLPVPVQPQAAPVPLPIPDMAPASEDEYKIRKGL